MVAMAITLSPEGAINHELWESRRNGLVDLSFVGCVVLLKKLLS